MAGAVAILCATIVGTLASTGDAQAQFPSIDPTGQRIFAWPNTPFRPEPGSISYRNTTGLTVVPSRIIAPVGTEVVLLAAVCGQTGYLMANERVEWMLAPGGVGQFVALGDRYALDWLQGISGWPRKVDNSMAIGTTSSRYVTLTRGTPTPTDDVQVLKGQGWITVTSPVEGASYVTAFAPSVYGWDRRQKTSTIYWVDAQWAFPPPANSPLGTRRPLATTVTRQSDGAPLAGWLVRYEVTGVPAAGFAPDGGPTIEVVTDALGQATAELFQQQPATGSNNVSIQVIRPADLGGSYGQRLIVGSGGTVTTWTTASNVSTPGAIPQAPVAAPPINATAPRATPEPRQAPATAPSLPSAPAQPSVAPVPSLQLTMQGPRTATVGEQVTFVATVVNRGSTPATGLVVIDRFDAGLKHAQHRSPIEQPIVPLNPGQSRKINVALRVTQEGELCNVIEILGPDGTKTSARACLTAAAAAGAGGAAAGGAGSGDRSTTAQAKIEVKKTVPQQQLNVGQTAEFLIQVTNTGPTPLTRLKVVDHYDRALDPKMAEKGHVFEGDDLVWNIGALPPGKTIYFRVQCACLSPAARACNQATVTTAEGARDQSEACLEIRAATQQSAARPEGAAPQPGLSMTAADLGDPIGVGKETMYEVRVTNNSQSSDQQVVLVATLSAEITPLAVGTSGPAQSTIEGQTVRFAKVAEIRPGETLKYEIRGVAKNAGEARFQARLTSAAVAAAIVAEESTTVFAE